jgi:hypothetical protein
MEKPTYKITRWAILPTYPDGECLLGYPLLEEGQTHASPLVSGKKLIKTSRIIRKWDSFVETQNSIYQLCD